MMPPPPPPPPPRPDGFSSQPMHPQNLQTNGQSQWTGQTPAACAPPRTPSHGGVPTFTSASAPHYASSRPQNPPPPPPPPPPAFSGGVKNAGGTQHNTVGPPPPPHNGGTHSVFGGPPPVHNGGMQNAHGTPLPPPQSRTEAFSTTRSAPSHSPKNAPHSHGPPRIDPPRGAANTQGNTTPHLNPPRPSPGMVVGKGPANLPGSVQRQARPFTASRSTPGQGPSGSFPGPPPPPPHANEQDQTYGHNGHHPFQSYNPSFLPAQNSPLPPVPPPASQEQTFHQTANGQQQTYPPHSVDGQNTQPYQGHSRGPSPRIAPSQIPRIPCFTRPSLHPATLFNPDISLQSVVSDKIGNLKPPEPYERYACPLQSRNANPMYIRPTSYVLPQNKKVAETCAIPLAVCLQPFGGDGAYALPDAKALPQDVDTSHLNNATIEVPLISYPGKNQPPIRCTSCSAYLNPMDVQDKRQSSETRFNYTCSLCNKWSSTTIESQSPEIVQAIQLSQAYGVVDHAVGGPYLIRPSPKQCVMLYALDISLFVGGNIDGFIRFRSAIMEGVIPALRSQFWHLSNQAQQSSQVTPEGSQGSRGMSPRVGFFLYDGEGCYLPYFVPPKDKQTQDRSDLQQQHDEDDDEQEGEVQVAFMTDIFEDPFCPIPALNLTFDTMQDVELRNMQKVLDAAQEIISRQNQEPRMLETPPSNTANASGQTPLSSSRSAGGAALAVLFSALADTGGRGILVTPNAPNVGIGTIRSVPSGPPSWQPLQTSKQSHPVDESAATFYSKLAEDCSRESTRFDVVLLERIQSSMDTSQSESSFSSPSRTNMASATFFDSFHDRAIATLGQLCQKTCGKLTRVRLPPKAALNLEDSVECPLRKELVHLAAIRYTAMDCILKLRLSDGIRLSSCAYPGNPQGQILDRGILNSDSPELELSYAGPETCLVMELQHSVGGISSSRPPRVILQAALLYTTPLGQRRVRVMTLCVPTTSNATAVFRNSDCTAIATTMVRTALVGTFMRPPNKDERGKAYNQSRLALARQALLDAMVDIFVSYRLYTQALRSPAGQLVLPESLQLLPLWTLSIMKCRAFQYFSRHIQGSDRRTFHEAEALLNLQALQNVGPSLVMLLVHPNLYRLDSMTEFEGTVYHPQPSDSGGGTLWTSDTDHLQRLLCRPYVRLPNTTHLSISCLEEEGIYVLDDGLTLYVIVGSNVSRDVLLETFGIEKQADLDREVALTHGLDCFQANTSMGSRARYVLNALRHWHRERSKSSPVFVISSHSGWNDDEQSMRNLLVDDPMGQEKSYVDFLVVLHRRIKIRVEEES